MKKKVVVLSLGGSLIIPDKINYDFLEKFKKAVRKFYGKYKFVIVCGGGAIARTYISALREEHRTKSELSKAGIRATRMNAMFMMQFFGKDANETIPKDAIDIGNQLKKNDVVFCGALRFMKDSTSDGVAAMLARHFRCDFINLTDVNGLYSDDPKKNKNAKFIPYESWKDFANRASKIKFKAGQHFILDQNAADFIKKYRVRTYILGKNMKNLENVLKGKKFIGTIIEG